MQIPNVLIEKLKYIIILLAVLSAFTMFSSCEEEEGALVANFAEGQFMQNDCSYADSLQSPASGVQPTSIKFINQSSVALKIYWINFSGTLTFYHHLAPNETATQGTFLQHPWYITTEDDQCVTILTALRPVLTDEVTFANE